MLFTVGVLSQEEAVLYEYEDYDFECPDEYLGYFPHLFRYGHQEVVPQICGTTRKWRGNLYSLSNVPAVTSTGRVTRAWQSSGPAATVWPSLTPTR